MGRYIIKSGLLFKQIDFKKITKHLKLKTGLKFSLIVNFQMGR